MIIALNLTIMTKTYNYKDLQFPVADATEIVLEVKFISDGNSSHTVVNRPGDLDPELEGQGTVTIGTGSELRAETTYVVTAVDNLLPQVENIKVLYKLNGKDILLHTNPRSESQSPIIVLHINFPSI